MTPRCQECGKMIVHPNGILCANFGVSRGVSGQPCMRAWHGSCYKQDANDDFPVWCQEVEEDQVIDDDLMEDEDPQRFKEARDGDHLMSTFQCDWCHFENIEGRSANPERFVSDGAAMKAIRRAQLDAFWARERSTVNSNRLEAIKYRASGSEAGWSRLYCERGPFPVRDDAGMRDATIMLLRSRDPGKNARTIQFETLRKMRSHLANFYHTTPGGLGSTFVAEDGGGGTISFSPTNSPWFKRWIRGCHRRMGDVWIPDRPLTIKELKCCIQLLEEDWKLFAANDDKEGQKGTALLAVALIAGFFGALRGEEVVRLDVGAMREHWHESLDYPECPHVPMMLAGRFKQEIGEKLFCQPLAMVSNSGIAIALWFHRTLEILSKFGVISGPVFRVKGKSKGSYKKASTADLDPVFHGLLERVQKRWPSVIAESVKVESEYSMFRSCRRGATSEAQNVNLPQATIEANNRWRKKLRSKGMTPNMSMMERYSDAKASVKHLIKFSQSL